jgi:hypothetical protein
MLSRLNKDDRKRDRKRRNTDRVWSFTGVYGHRIRRPG